MGGLLTQHFSRFDMRKGAGENNCTCRHFEENKTQGNPGLGPFPTQFNV